MKNEFLVYYQPTEEELQAIWNNGLIVLDTNVLLDLYQFSQATRDDLLNILHAVSDRLWLPHQVGLEYQENRLTVIDRQVESFRKVKRALKSARGTLDRVFGENQLKDRHALINPSEFLEKVAALFDDYSKELDQLRRQHLNVQSHDKLRDEIDKLFEGKIGPPPTSQDDLDKIYEEGKVRYEHKVPPGYCNQDKDGSILYDEMLFKRAFGDLILWKELIREAESRSDLEHVIFVTGERQEDWWWIFKGPNSNEETLIGPRRELVTEIVKATGISTFLMYETPVFMQDAQNFLDVDVAAESVSHARDVVEEAEVERKKANVRRFFPITGKHFLEETEPQKIVVTFTNQSEQGIRVFRVLYSDQTTGLPMNALLSYPRNEKGRMIVFSDPEGKDIMPGEDFTVNLELAARWKEHDILRWAGEWGYLRIFVSLDDKLGEIEEFYSF